MVALQKRLVSEAVGTAILLAATVDTLARQRLAEAAVSRGRRYEANRLLGRARALAFRSDLLTHLLVRVYGTMIQAARGLFSLAAKSSRELEPVAPSPASAFTFCGLRSDTTH